MERGRQIDLNVLHVFQNSPEVISVQTRDRQIFNLVGNASRYLTLSPPFQRLKDGTLVVPEGYVKFCTTITFHFAGGQLDGRKRSCDIVDGHKVMAGDDDVGAPPPRNNALYYFGATCGGEPGQRLQIPSNVDLEFYEYDVERRKLSVEHDQHGEFPVVSIIVDVFCKPAHSG